MNAMIMIQIQIIIAPRRRFDEAVVSQLSGESMKLNRLLFMVQQTEYAKVEYLFFYHHRFNGDRSI